MSLNIGKLKAFNVFRMDQSQTIDSPPFDKFFNGNLDKLVSKLNSEVEDKNAHAEDPAASTWRKTGFAPLWDTIPGFESAVESEIVEVEEDVTPCFVRLIDDVVFGIVEIRERIVPGDVLRTEIDKECAALEGRQGEAVTRKQRMEIKDVIVARLLATALVKVKPVPVAFIPDDLQNDVVNVVVFNSSRKVCEDVTALFRQVFVSFPVRPIEYDYELPMQNILTSLVSAPAVASTYKLVPGSAVKLVSPHQGEYTLKDESLQSNDHLDDLLNEGYMASRLMIRHFPRGIIDDHHVYSQFMLNTKAGFSALKLSDVLVMENTSDESDAWIDFQATTQMVFNEIARMLASLENYAKWLNERFEGEKPKADEIDENDLL